MVGMAEKVQQREKDNKYIDKAKLKILRPDIYFCGRGIKEHILAKHNVGYWQKTGTFMDRRAIVAIYDVNNKLVGFSGRVIISEEERKNTTHAKWMHGSNVVPGGPLYSMLAFWVE